ncbi:MAG: hypothetical protein HFG26_04005 [Provencibacterium sp.]|nr:hypothetical protein [Provencibacterium sp.]
MRITQNMITRNYLNSINFSQENMAKVNQRVSSSRRYTRISENLADGARALRVRKQLADIRQQKADARDAKGLLSSAESNLRAINDVLVTAHEKALRGENGPMESVREEVAKEIDNLKEQVLQFMNTQYAGKFVMGGVNNKEAPYKVDKDGVLRYNGVDINSIESVNGEYQYTDENGDVQTIPYDKDVYIDLGLGLSYSDGGQIDPRSAFKVSFNGLDVLGFGYETVTLEDGSTHDIPNNVYNLMDKIGDMFSGDEPYNDELMGVMVDKLEKERESMFLSITEIGNRDRFLDTVVERLDSDELVLTETRSDLEGVKDTEEAIRMSMYEYSWLATLRMGAKLLPQSLMDYLN